MRSKANVQLPEVGSDPPRPSSVSRQGEHVNKFLDQVHGGVDAETGKRGLYGLISGVNTDNGNRVTAIYRQEGDHLTLTVIAVDLSTPAANDN